MLQTKGEKSAENTWKAVQKLKKDNPGLKFLDNGDFTRPVVDCSALGINGGDAYRLLREHNVTAEFFDDRRVIFIISVFERPSDMLKLTCALKALSGVKGDARFDNVTFGGGDCVTIDFAENVRETEEVELSSSEGRTAAENAGFYPPSVPVVLAGEKITAEQIEVLSGHSGSFFNMKNGKIKVRK